MAKVLLTRVDKGLYVAVIEAMVIIEGSKIKAVGKDIEVPKGAKVIDATGKMVMPGLIDSHMHHMGAKTNMFQVEEIIRPRELELLVKYCDFIPMDAIVAATKNGAMACFMGDKTGTIQLGKFADIIVDGNPLADIKVLQDVEKIKLVMLEGKVEVDTGL